MPRRLRIKKWPTLPGPETPATKVPVTVAFAASVASVEVAAEKKYPVDAPASDWIEGVPDEAFDLHCLWSWYDASELRGGFTTQVISVPEGTDKTPPDAPPADAEIEIEDMVPVVADVVETPVAADPAPVVDPAAPTA